MQHLCIFSNSESSFSHRVKELPFAYMICLYRILFRSSSGRSSGFDSRQGYVVFQIHTFDISSMVVYSMRVKKINLSQACPKSDMRKPQQQGVHDARG